MDIIYLIYGFAFMVAGLAIYLRNRGESSFLLAGDLRFLALFAVAHGAVEWTDLWRVVRGDPQWLAALRPWLILVSFLPLMEFGRRVTRNAMRDRAESLWSQFLDRPVIVYLVTFLVFCAAMGLTGWRVTNFSIWTRYVIGFPSALLSGLGVIAYYNAVMRHSPVLMNRHEYRRYCYGVGAALIAYGVFAGIIGPAENWFPVSVVNQDEFQSLAGIPVQLARTACALVLAVFAGLLVKFFQLEVEHDLRGALQAAQAASLAKNRFLATMSHELRTPLNGILGMAQLMLMPDLPEAKRIEYARTVLTSGESLLNLLNDILDLSKIELGKLKLHSMEFDPEVVLRETTLLFAGSAKAKNLRIEYQWSGPQGVSYQTDSHRLHQMLFNLVGNAIKFTPNGGIRIVGTQVSEDADEALLEFSVHDTGIGIAADQMALLFQPFSQLDASTTRKFDGAGLGLSIVRQLAVAMGGDVGVESTEGRGSRFWFRIRARSLRDDVDRRRSERGVTDDAPKAPSAPPRSNRVLVVEDNAVNRMFVQVLLEKLGFEVSLAHDGQQALDAVMRGDAADVVLMDIQMPVLDGYGATQGIRRWESQNSGRRLPIIALTANAFEDDRQLCLAAGMDDFLTKPVDAATLHAALLQWLTPGAGQTPVATAAA